VNEGQSRGDRGREEGEEGGGRVPKFGYSGASRYTLPSKETTSW
jgi:hypothetical protein